MRRKFPHKKQATSSATGRDSWAKVRLGDICEIVRGVSYKKDQASEQPENGKVPILRATNIQECTVVLDRDLVHVPSTVVSKEQMLQVGDIVVATSSGSKHLVGKTAQVKQAWEGSFGAFCATLRPKVDIDHRYLGHFFGTQEYKDYISKKALGVNINNLRRGDLEEISVPVAPFDQQKRIVEEIEKQFSRLDEAVANLKRIKANLKRYKAAVLKAAVEGKLTEAWRRAHPDVEPANKLLERILADRQAKWRGKGKYKELAELGTTYLPTLPERWAWITTGQLCDCIVPNRDKPKSFSGSIPWLTLPDFNEDQILVSDSRIELGLTPEEVETFKAKVVPKDSVVMSCVGRFGITAVLGRGAVINQQLHAFLPNNNIVPRYLGYALRTRTTEMLAASAATTIAYLNKDKCNSVHVPLPPVPEQERIVDEVERRLSVIAQLDATVEANLTRTNRLRQSILSQAFSGRLLRQDPKIISNNEPTFSLAVESQPNYGKEPCIGQ